MGVSTDAIIAFGFDLGEETPSFLKPNGDDESSIEFEEFVTNEAGINYPDGFRYGTPEYTAYSEARDAALKACPVDVVMHCSYDYPMYFLAVRGTEVNASRGNPKKVEQQQIDFTAVGAMREWCKNHGVEWQEPAWHIFSMWG